jgi:hypothetical protein
MPDALDPVALAALHADAENPLIPPSRRIAARKTLKAVRDAEAREADAADEARLIAAIAHELASRKA